MSTQLLIRCGHCQGRHNSIAEVRVCGLPIKPCAYTVQGLFHDRHIESDFKCVGLQAAPGMLASKGLTLVYRGQRYASRGCTQSQLEYIVDRLGGDVMAAVAKTKFEASNYIDDLKKGRRAVSTMHNAPNRRETKIPLDMLKALPDGYYASRMDSTYPMTFFRISRPKSGQYNGALKIQTQHGEDLKLALVIYPGDRIYWTNMSVEDELLLVTVDPNGATIAYAEELKHCCRCNKDLTDERSRWFGIGPECEKYWPQIIGLVTDRKGPFVPGWEQRL